jgi:hypothetical protein
VLRTPAPLNGALGVGTMSEGRIYLIEDEVHSDGLGGRYSTFESALAEVQRIVTLPFEEEPHNPPCASWQQCKREIVIKEVEIISSPQIPGPRLRVITEIPILTTSANGVIWMKKKYARLATRLVGLPSASGEEDGSA